MASFLESLSRTDVVRKSWPERFHDKWPNITTMMHQSELTLHPQTHAMEYSEDSLDTIFRNPKLPGWEDSNHDLYADPRIMDHEILEEESSTTGSRDRKPTERTCEKRCRTVLCGFLIFSIISVTIAAVGVSIYVTQEDTVLHDLFKTNKAGENEADLNRTQQSYFSDKFCDLVNIFLRSTDFPVETGIASCNTVLKYGPNSDSILIELEITPKKGYTIREKFLRAIKEKTVGDGVYGLNVRKSVIGTGGKIMKNSLVNQSIRSVFGFPKNRKNPTHSTTTIKPTTAKNLHDSRATVLGTADFTVNETKLTGTAKLTTTPSIKIPSETRTHEEEKTFPPDTVTQSAQSETTTEQNADLFISSTTTDYFTTVTSFPTITTSRASVLPEVSEIRTEPKVRVPLFNAPVATKLFIPTFGFNGFTGHSQDTLSTTAESMKPSNNEKNNMAAESLMAGGVMRFPLKTNSNFRFLLLNNNRQSDSNPNEVSVEKATFTRNSVPNEPEVKFVRGFTPEPKIQEQVRTLRLPNVSTKSVLAPNVEFRKPTIIPRKLVDVTLFG